MAGDGADGDGPRRGAGRGGARRSADRRRRSSATARSLARAGNRTIELDDPTAHAEMLAIRAAAAAAGSQRLAGADLYVTLEPCAMCAAAISFARSGGSISAPRDPKGGAVENGVRLLRAADLPPRARGLWRASAKREAADAAAGSSFGGRDAVRRPAASAQNGHPVLLAAAWSSSWLT